MMNRALRKVRLVVKLETSMNNRLFPLIAVISVFLAACTQTQSTPVPDAGDIPFVVDDEKVFAEGHLVPKEFVRLAFVASGRVAEILVEEGDVVNAGEVVARLGDREILEAAVAGAQLEISAAELEKVAAEADLLSAELALEALNENWPQQATLAQQALKDARQRQYNANRNLGYLTSAASQTDIDLAFTQVVLAENALERAKENFEPYENKPADNLVRAAFQQKLAEAQKSYDAAVRVYNALIDTSNDFDISQGEAELAIANAQLEQAEQDYNELLNGPDPDDVALAEARIKAAQARIETAGQRILTAQTNLAAAQSNLDNLDLVATITGTVVEIDLIAGEQVTPGVPVVQIADFSSWYVETDNLTEIEVVNVAVGQPVSVTPDSLTDVVLTGTVEDISDLFEEKRGDVTYTARILLDNFDPRLRWGMIVVVTFEE